VQCNIDNKNIKIVFGTGKGEIIISYIYKTFPSYNLHVINIMNRRRLSILYAVFDLLSSAGAWLLFCFILNKAGKSGGSDLVLTSEIILKGAVVISISWVFLYAITGFYVYSLKRSRLAELTYSLAVTIPGVFILFLVLLSKGIIKQNSAIIYLLELLFFLQFFLTYVPRVLITSSTARKVHKGLIGYSTLIVGSNGKAFDIYKKIKEEKIPGGNILSGYVSTRDNDSGPLKGYLPYLGQTNALNQIISDFKIEEVIIAIEGDEYDTIGAIIGKLEYNEITIKAIPSLKDILTGRVEQTAIFGTPLLEISNRLMPVWQANIKQIMDYALSFIFLIVLSPVIMLLSLLIKLSGKGPVIFSQERIGKNGKPFTIYKFRSMNADAETGEPMLSGVNDKRITGIGRFMRKHRFDEIPNLMNVLKGEMSLVGPRPEREFFINQIVRSAPHYRMLHKVKPGITSWGQVKFGYASNVDQMIERLEYDLLYLENMSLLIDLKIMIYTLLIILKGKGV
jgi:exopolysaccharide biosynthesis polyprenyl glycosylphosphotransferase